MVDLDSKLLLSELYPKLHNELRFLRAEVISEMSDKTEDLDVYIGYLSRMIGVYAEAHNCSLFKAAVRIWERSSFLSIPPIVAIAAAIEMTAAKTEDD